MLFGVLPDSSLCQNGKQVEIITKMIFELCYIEAIFLIVIRKALRCVSLVDVAYRVHLFIVGVVVSLTLIVEVAAENLFYAAHKLLPTERERDCPALRVNENCLGNSVNAHLFYGWRAPSKQV